MDWPKAKNVLIVGFLLLDLFLAYLLFYEPGARTIQTALTNEDLEALTVLSQHFNVDLAARPKPMAVRPLPLLQIAEVSLDEQLAASLAEHWLGPNLQESKKENGLVFTAGSKTIAFSQDSPYFFTMEYVDTAPAAGEVLSIQEAIGVAQGFIRNYLGEDAGYKVNMAVAAPDAEASYIIELSRAYQGVPIFLDSYRLTVSKGLVTAFTAKQAVVGQAERSSLPLVTAEKVMRRYLARLGEPQEQKITILDLSLGYGVGVEMGERQEIEPVWRFYLAGAEESEVIIPAAQIYWERPDH